MIPKETDTCSKYSDRHDDYFCGPYDYSKSTHTLNDDLRARRQHGIDGCQCASIGHLRCVAVSIGKRDRRRATTIQHRSRTLGLGTCAPRAHHKDHYLRQSTRAQEQEPH